MCVQNCWRKVSTVRFRSQGVAIAEGKGASAASAADMTIFADTAFAFEGVGVPKCAEQRRVLIHVDQRIAGEYAAADGQEAARINLADMADEHDSAAIVGADVGTFQSSRRTGFAGFLKQESAVVRRFGSFDRVRLDAAMAIELIESDLVLLGCDPLIGLAAAGGKQKEDRPEHDIHA